MLDYLLCSFLCAIDHLKYVIANSLDLFGFDNLYNSLIFGKTTFTSLE